MSNPATEAKTLNESLSRSRSDILREYCEGGKERVAEATLNAFHFHSLVQSESPSSDYIFSHWHKHTHQSISRKKSSTSFFSITSTLLGFISTYARRDERATGQSNQIRMWLPLLFISPQHNCFRQNNPIFLHQEVDVINQKSEIITPVFFFFDS
jgi:hypothetical protein